jgi:hypothetical protein
MPRGKPLENAPGWRVIEHPQPRPRRRVSVTILTVAACLLLAFAVTYRYRAGWPADHHPQLATPAVIPAHRAAATPPPATATPAPERAIAAAPEPLAAPPPVGPLKASAGPPRIFIHYPAHQGDAAPAMRLAALLQTRGFEVADIRLVEIAVEHPSLRYFFARDRADSERLVDVLNALSIHQVPDGATDFSAYAPKPRPGTVELWLPASGPGPLAQDSSR